MAKPAIPPCTQGDKDCVATAAAIVASKWTPMLLYALSGEPRRFSALQEETGVNPRTLSARLLELEHAGIVAKTTYQEMPPRTEYQLTPKGKDLIPILSSMIAWGKKYAQA